MFLEIIIQSICIVGRVSKVNFKWTRNIDFQSFRLLVPLCKMTVKDNVLAWQDSSPRLSASANTVQTFKAWTKSHILKLTRVVKSIKTKSVSSQVDTLPILVETVGNCIHSFLLWCSYKLIYFVREKKKYISMV